MMYCQELRKPENNFNGLEYHHILHGWNEVADESSISRALSKARKAAESIEGTTPPNDKEPESSDIMTLHLDWHTPFMIYLKTRGLPEDKVK
jgi:hypothetical protein